ncbi:hypothetical protein D9M69_422720 [compost metagenome]
MDDQVEAQLHRVLQLGHRPRPAQAQRRAHAEDQRHAEGQAQGQPGQLQQLGLVGETHRAGLGGEDEDADQGQPQEVLAAGGQQLYGFEHGHSQSWPEYNQGSPRPACVRQLAAEEPADGFIKSCGGEFIRKGVRSAPLPGTRAGLRPA